MKNRIYITPKDYYLWKDRTNRTYPWQREYLNSEFLEYERKKVKESMEWHKKFRKSSHEWKGRDERIALYTLPIKLSSFWKAAVSELGEYNIMALSALYNTPVTTVMALIPKDIKRPYEYRLIDIIDSERAYVLNKRDNITDLALIIKEWDYLPSDTIYRYDVKYERNLVKKLLKENLSSDPSIYADFQSPILSSPFILGDKGGVSLASFASREPFSYEFIKTIELLVPPEYRSIGPPKKAFSGSKFRLMNGIEIKPAERPYNDKNYLSGLLVKNYKFIENEQKRRQSFKGEFSIFSTLKIDQGHASRVWSELFIKFPKTEITLPYSLDDLLKSDIVVKNLKKEITEEVWANIAKSRDFNPIVSDEKLVEKFGELLRRDIEIYLDQVFHSTNLKEMIVMNIIGESMENLRRIAQSFARGEGRNEVNERDFMNARGVILSNLDGFLNHEQFKPLLIGMQKKKASISMERFYIVQYELMSHPDSTLEEILENVKGEKVFRDIYDLQAFLDWLHREGYVVVRNGIYKWI